MFMQQKAVLLGFRTKVLNDFKRSVCYVAIDFLRVGPEQVQIFSDSEASSAVTVAIFF